MHLKSFSYGLLTSNFIRFYFLGEVHKDIKGHIITAEWLIQCSTVIATNITCVLLCNVPLKMLKKGLQITGNKLVISSIISYIMSYNLKFRFIFTRPLTLSTRVAWKVPVNMKHTLFSRRLLGLYIGCPTPVQFANPFRIVWLLQSRKIDPGFRNAILDWIKPCSC